MITVLGGGGPDRASPKIKRVGANLQAPRGECQPKYKARPIILSHATRILMPPWLVVSILRSNFDEGPTGTTTTITPHGLFGYELLQFGVSSTSAISQCIVGTSIFMHTLMIFL